jgi:hypothetical protein
LHGKGPGLAAACLGCLFGLLLVGLQVLQMPPRRRGMRTCEVTARGESQGEVTAGSAPSTARRGGAAAGRGGRQGCSNMRLLRSNGHWPS